MVKARQEYRGGIVRGFTIPSVNFNQFDAQTNLASELDKRLNVVKKFAMEKGRAAAVERAVDYVAGNAPDLHGFATAGNEYRKQLVESGYFEGKVTADTNNLFDKALQEAQLNVIKSKLESIATQDFNNILLNEKLRLDAGEPGDFNAAAGQITAVVNGLSDALVGVDGSAALDVKATLAKTGDTYFKSIGELHVEAQARRQRQADYISLEDFQQKMVLEIVTDGALRPVPSGAIDESTGTPLMENTIDSIEDAIDEKADIMIGSQVEPSFLATWKQETLNLALDTLAKTALTRVAGEVDASSQTTLHNMKSNYLNNKYVNKNLGDDPEIKAVAEILEKRNVDKYNTFNDNMVKIIEDKLTANKNKEAYEIEQDLKNYNAKKLEYYRATTRTEAETILEELRTGLSDGSVDLGFAPARHSSDLATIIEKHDARINDISFVAATYKKLKRGTALGIVDEEQIEEAYNNYEINHLQYGEFVLKMQTELDSAYSDNKSRLKSQFKISDILTSATEVSESYLLAEEELFDYYIAQRQEGTLTEKGLNEYTSTLLEKYQAGGAAANHLVESAKSVRKSMERYMDIVAPIMRDVDFSDEEFAVKLSQDAEYARSYINILTMVEDAAGTGDLAIYNINTEALISAISKARTNIKKIHPSLQGGL